MTAKLALVLDEIKAANVRVDVLTGQLTESEHKHNLVCAELERFHVIESLKGLNPASATTEFNQQIKDSVQNVCSKLFLQNFCSKLFCRETFPFSRLEQ